MQVATDFIEQGFPIRTVLKHCSVSKSTFYRKPTGGKPGRKPYAKYLNAEGQEVSEEHILERIKMLFSKPFVDYGSYKTYRHLTDREFYKISKHSVYNIMKNNNLTRVRYQESSKKGKRKWVKELVPKPLIPFSFLEFDIKFVWVPGQKKNVQVLTILDVYSRFNMGQYIACKIRKENVIELFQKIIIEFGLPRNFIVRNDNGSQFIAQQVQEYLREQGIDQEFTKPGTPQQNAHIESYHSIMERAVCQRFEFENVKEAKKTLNLFRDFYNFERIHGGVEYQSPYEYLLQKEVEVNPTPLLKSFLLVKQSYKKYQNVS